MQLIHVVSQVNIIGNGSCSYIVYIFLPTCSRNEAGQVNPYICNEPHRGIILLAGWFAVTEFKITSGCNPESQLSRDSADRKLGDEKPQIVQDRNVDASAVTFVS